MINCILTFIDLDKQNDTHQTSPNTSEVAPLQDTDHENAHTVNERGGTRKLREYLSTGRNSLDRVPVHSRQHGSVVNVDQVHTENESVSQESRASAEQLSFLESSSPNAGKKD